MRTACLFFLLLLMFLFLKSTLAQPYFFTNYSIDNGLSNNAVVSIVKDYEGFIWVGTEAGLNRFNGYEFTVFKSLASDSTTLPSNVIRHLLVSHSGILWVATASGVCMYDRLKNSFKRVPYFSAKDKADYQAEYAGLYEDSKMNILAVTIGDGLLKFDSAGGFFQQLFSPGEGQSKNLMSSVIEDSEGVLWVSSYSHLYRFNPADNSAKEFQNNLVQENNTRFQAIGIFTNSSDKNSLWLITWGDGIVRFNKQTGEFFSYKLTPNGSRNIDNIVFDLHNREQNMLWLATNKGTVEFDPVRNEYGRFISDSISENPVVNTQSQCIYRDDKGITWIGTVHGVANIHPAKQIFIQEPMWPHAPVPKFYYDELNEIFYGVRFYSNRSLVIYNRKTNVQTTYPIPHADELRAEPFSVFKDENGLIWIGTTRGVYTFDERNKKFELLAIEKDLNIPDRTFYVRSIFKDGNGNLWFAWYGTGLIMLDIKTRQYTTYFKDAHNKTGFPLDAINKIAESDKIVYACDDYNGLVMINPVQKEWKHFSPADKRYAMLKGATDMGIDLDQNLWITTKNNGLICIDHYGDVETFIKDDFGLVDEQHCIAIDKAGKIWLAASRGIFRFDPIQKLFYKFSLENGFPAKTLDGSFYAFKNGNLAYQFNKGIFAFDPQQVSTTGEPLQIHIVSLSVNGKLAAYNNIIDNLDTIKLSHLENNLTFEFAATNFFNATSTQYSYKLEGNDHSWSSPSRTRTVNYSQLVPGNYILRIKAGENFPEKKMFIHIIPAWWQTTWFQGLLVLLVFALLFYSVRFILSIRYRQQIAELERQREIEAIRTRISRDIHDDIGSGLTKIKLMIRNLSKTNGVKAMEETTARISSASDELIQNLSEIVWTVNPANDSIENVIAYIRNYLLTLFDENPEIKLSLDFPELSKIPRGILLNPEVKRNLLLILKEAITNIFKHARADNVQVILGMEKSKMEIRIKDNGMGLSPTHNNNFGNGLKNMRKRAESIRARFNIESINGYGTEIIILIPIGNS